MGVVIFVGVAVGIAVGELVGHQVDEAPLSRKSFTELLYRSEIRFWVVASPVTWTVPQNRGEILALANWLSLPATNEPRTKGPPGYTGT